MQFHDPLIKLFQSPQVIAAYADESERLARCSETLALWIDLVKFRDNPAVSVGFINTEPGLRALMQAQKQVFQAHSDYLDLEQEIELDPQLVEMYQMRFGDNWKQKRAELLDKGK